MAAKMKIMVTGGAGFIGSHCVRMLLEKGYSVRVLDSLLFGDEALKPLMDGSDRLELIRGDIRHVEDVVAATKGCHGVIHLAGIVGDPACELDTEATHTINYEATKIMVEVAKYASVKRFVFASTCSVYGAADDYVLNEGSLVNPVSLYAETNLRSEQVILRGFEGSRTVPTIVRFATVYGVSRRMRFDLVVNIMSAKAHYDKKVRVFGGDQWRPNVHVQDAARGLIACMEAPEDRARNEVFNIGSNDQNYKIRELGEIVARTLPGVGIEMVKDSPDKRSYHVAFDKARHVLGFEVHHTVAQGVLETAKLLESGAIANYLDDRYYNVKYMYK
ncbi:MAG: NAD(P)-dependent oxidoreductase [Candidatus Eisenbacteria bacterium]|nr:NAD(P)-dependent oxidoreductase [Candidatus Eisenbacteria bacterium]